MAGPALAEGGRQAHVQRVGGEGAEVDGRVRCLARAGPAGSGIIIGIGKGGEGLVGVVRLVHGFGLRIQGTLIPQDQGWVDFRPKKIRKTEKI